MASKREQCKSCKMECTERIFQIKLNTARIPFDKCLDFTPKQTNADRIRAMSDEEMSTDFVNIFEELFEDGVPSPEWMKMWLQSEAE